MSAYVIVDIEVHDPQQYEEYKRLVPASFLFPGGQLFPPSFVVIVLVALLGYRYLRGAREITVNQRL
jgi:hypothetical protein